MWVHSSRRWLIVVSTITGLLAGAGCVDTSPGRSLGQAQYCEETAEVDCRVYWQCFTTAMREARAAELALQGVDIGANQRACEVNLKASCAAATICPADQVFQEMKAGSCLNGKQGLSCTEWVNGDDEDLRACDSVCTPRTTGLSPE